MQIFKTSDVQFTVINSQLKEGKDLSSRGKKLTDAAKARCLTWLKTERAFDIEAQPVGTIVVIQLDGNDCIKIERKGRNAVDLRRLSVERPEVAAEFTALQPATYIDAI